SWRAPRSRRWGGRSSRRCWRGRAARRARASWRGGARGRSRRGASGRRSEKGVRNLFRESRMTTKHRILVAAAVLCLAARLSAGEDAAAVKKAVVAAQEAGWLRHDFKAYMEQWTKDARLEFGRAEKSGAHDHTFDHGQIQKTRKLLMTGKPPEGQRLEFDDVKVEVKEDEAELRCRTTFFFATDLHQTVAEIYQLRKTAAGWRVYRNRGWYLEMRTGAEVTRFDEKTWRRLD